LNTYLVAVLVNSDPILIRRGFHGRSASCDPAANWPDESVHVVTVGLETVTDPKLWSTLSSLVRQSAEEI
jgi:hypothetical protein